MAKEIIELDDTEYVFKYKGKEMTLREPTVSEGFALSREIENCEDDAEMMFDKNIVYLGKLGGDVDALRSMSLKNIMKVVEVVNGKKN